MATNPATSASVSEARIAFLSDVIEHGFDHAVMGPLEMAYRSALIEAARREAGPVAIEPVNPTSGGGGLPPMNTQTVSRATSL